MDDPTRAPAWQQAAPALATFAVCIICFHGIYSVFFPLPNGMMGHDWALTLPGYYDGLLWFRNNSLVDLPWFTPSFCGGQPFYADPQSGYLSLPQWLLFFLEPTTGMYFALLILASLGFWGYYLLCRKIFAVSLWPALLAGALMMFNAFIAHRWIVGHTGFQGFVLVPWIALLLLLPRELPIGRVNWGGNALLAGLLIAYWMQSGLGSIVLPTTLAIGGLACIKALHGTSLVPFMLRGFAAGGLALGLSAAKLVASFSFLAGFPRTDYRLPGFNGFVDSLVNAGRALVFSSQQVFAHAEPALVNRQWALAPHEWAYNLGPVPFLLILVCLPLWLRQQRVEIRGAWPTLAAIGLIVILVLPVFLNIYTPEWNAFLKSVPLIKSSSSLVRWYIIYIPLVIIACAILLDRVQLLARWRQWITGAAIGLLVGVSAFEDRRYYFNDGAGYAVAPATAAWQRVFTDQQPSALQGIAQQLDVNGELVVSNDLVFHGYSQATCYNPVFGYRLEYLPLGPLRAGPPGLMDDIYNLKNPACYVYGEANACAAGDHFRQDQTAQVARFIRYQPWEFAISGRQAVANRVTQAALLLVLVLALYGASAALLARLRDRAA